MSSVGISADATAIAREAVLNSAASSKSPLSAGVSGWRKAGTDLATVLGLGVAPIVSTIVLLILLKSRQNLAFDFHGWYWVAGNRVLHGLSPYSLPEQQAFNYPAVAALLFVPFALIPSAVADWVFTGLVLAAIPATLRALNVRDWRIYGIVMLWQPVVYGWETANATLLLVLGLALAWRFRDKARVVGLILALLISVKLFLLPIGLWLIATRRYVALAWATATTIVLNAIAWPVLGVGEFSQYAHTLRTFAATTEHRGYSLISLLLHLGTGPTAAYAVALPLAGIALAGAMVAGRNGADRASLAACLGACLLASPVVESHYLSLLMVPVALTRPRLSSLWAAPLILWLAPVDHPAIWQHALALAVAAAVMAATVVVATRWVERGRGVPRLVPQPSTISRY